MILQDLLAFDTVVIQCHDYPDADTIASGYGIYCYLRKYDKTPRLIYGGKKISKPNLLIMIERLGIPVEYVSELDFVPDLIVTADCVHGEKNVTDFYAEHYAAVDHHVSARNSSRLYEIRPEYGSCSSIIAVMLKDAGFDYNSNISLATALYYGLFTDTNGMSEISHPADRDLRDFTRCEKRLISLLTNSVLTLNELIIASNALGGVINDLEHHFAVTCAEKCDPNMLGYINDLVLQVDTVNVSVVCCFISGGIKISVRSCISDIKATELAKFITEDIGSGGGHVQKAGGFISSAKAPHLCQKNICSFLTEKVRSYFNSFDVIRADEYDADLSQMDIYIKKPQLLGYIPTTELFQSGTVFRVRSVEPDFEITADENVYLLVDSHCSAYGIEKDKFDATYIHSGETPVIEEDYRPRAIGYDMAAVELELRGCRSRGGARIYARELKRNVKLYTRWGMQTYTSGKSGDYLVVRMDDINDVYIIEKSRFSEIYEKEQNIT